MNPKKVTAPSVKSMKSKDRIGMITAYDYPSAKAADAAGADVILVGDSLGMVVLGYPDTLSVTVADMLHHTRAAARGTTHALLVGDMPYLSYHLSIEESVRNAGEFIRAGAHAVKIEGGKPQRIKTIEAILDAEIPVMGHLGLTPQSIHAVGGFKVQGKQLDAARAIVDDAVALAETGCFAIVLECVPDAVARIVTDSVSVPTIGIGAGRHCDGQVLVYHDLLGLEDRIKPKFVRRYASMKTDATAAVARYAEDVRAGRFPSSDETYHVADDVAEALGLFGAAPA